jgi:hypothetical protein
MSPALHVTLSMSLSMGIPLVWAVRELLVMRADLGGSRRHMPEPDPAPKPLPSGLVPPDYALTRARQAQSELV